ncbi:putative mitochondrial-processing peptidase subunit beta, mitochondrial [Nicotiana attenuata]|uniref:Mitochondrial-processing peptidase subunit beta, mitochondrial n=1 Tax=Nicotiana attenuata TaxID=49451 RepID=A0A1J6KIB8_NICAT|nr:putative mitochondrial-processing peptidase subunit beta, mitochondrial [Nicotiana attenuata]
MDLQKQYENLRARQLGLRVVMEQMQQELREDMDRKQAELIQIISSLKHSIDKRHLHLQSKEVAENHRHFQKLEDKLSEKWVKFEESCEYYCKSCSVFCSSGRYYRLKYEDLSLCWKCFKSGKFNLETSPSDSVLIESAEVLEEMCLDVLFMENESYMKNESWNIAHNVLDKMPKPVYGAVESDLDALDDMGLPTLFNEAERITNAHKVSNGMTGRDHVKVVHVFIINESKFSLVLVGNEMVVPLWDPGIGLNALTSVKIASQTNDVREKLMDFSNIFCLPRSFDDMRRVWDTGWNCLMYPKVVDIELRNVDCREDALRALCYKLPMDLVEASILQIGKKRLFDNVSRVKVTKFSASWEDRAKHVLISKIEIIALKFDMVLMAFCYKWHMVPKLREACFGVLPDSVLIESAGVLEDMCLDVLFMENVSYNDIDSVEDTFMAELFMKNESWNIAHNVLDKMPKPVYGAVESDLDALDDMGLPTLFSEAERITNAHKVSDGMTGRDHVKVVHVFIINESKFSLVLVGNEMVVPLWDPGIEALRALCYKLPMDLMEASILQIGKKSGICYKWHMVPKLREACFGVLPGIIMDFVLGDLLKMNGYSKQVVAISKSTIAEGARLCGATKITRVDINFNKFEIRKHMGYELAQKVGMGAFNTNYIDTVFFGLYAAARPDCLSKLAHCIMLEINKLCYQVLDVGLTRACNQLGSSLKQPCWIVLLNATYSWFPFDPGGYSHP